MATRKSQSAKQTPPEEDKDTVQPPADETATEDKAKDTGSNDPATTDDTPPASPDDATTPNDDDQSNDDDQVNDDDDQDEDALHDDTVAGDPERLQKALRPVRGKDVEAAMQGVDVSDLYAVVNPSRGDVDGVIRLRGTGETVLEIDYGDGSNTIENIKADLKSMGLKDEQIDTLGA